MYAVVQTGGKQYRVQEGANIKVEKLPAEIGQEVELNRVLLVAKDDANLLVGDTLKNTRILAEVVGQDKGEKLTMFKFKRRKRYKRKIGHRQLFTELKIKAIQV